jgi:hypothetical protein
MMSNGSLWLSSLAAAYGLSLMTGICAKLREHPKIFMLGFAMTVAAVLLAAVALYESSNAQSIVSVILAAGLCVLASIWLPPVLAKGNLYMFLASVRFVRNLRRDSAMGQFGVT